MAENEVTQAQEIQARDERGKEVRAGLDQFTGTTEYHRLSLLHLDVVVTDGVKYLCEAAGAHWLIDCIASWQRRARKDPALRSIQFWRLVVEERWTHEAGCPVRDAGTPCCDKTLHRGAVLTCARDEGDDAFRQRIPYTDFPLDEARVWVQPTSVGGTRVYVAMLPGEY